LPRSDEYSRLAASLARSALEWSAVGADVARGILSGEAFLPRQLLLNGVGMAAASAAALSGLLPGSNRSRWLDLSNKLAAYRWFASADRFLGDRRDKAGLARAVERVRELDPYAAVWAMEGVGYHHALRGGEPGGKELAPHVRLPLHTGAGLARAEASLESKAQFAMDRVLSDFWEECGSGARDGCNEVLFEALGLVSATLYPNRVSELARHPSAITEEQSALFWHGVGRGLYFSPISFLPLAEARQRVFTRALDWPTTDTGRQNAIAGLAWAVTLVNVRDPEAVFCWLVENADEIQSNHAFRNGATSALIVWLSVAPQDQYVEALGSYRPAHADQAFAELWQDTVVRACRDARPLTSGELAARVFRVRPLQI